MTSGKVLRPADRIQRSAAVIFTEINHETMLLDPVAGKYIGLDAVGSEIWRRLETPQRVEKICDDICGHFDGEPALIAREASVFLERLRMLELVQVEART